MNLNYSIKKTVFLIFGGFTLLLSIIYSALTIMAAYIVEDEVLEKLLTYEVNAINNAYQKDGVIAQPSTAFMTVYDHPQSAPFSIAQAYKNNRLTREIFTNDQHYHIQYLNLNENSTHILVAEVSPFLSVSSPSNELVILFLTVFSAAIFISIWLAYRISVKITRPVTNLANEVERQKNQSENIKLTKEEHKSEVKVLAGTIRNALNDLTHSVKRESDFNRDVSHELRTPLTVIHNTLSLAKNRSLTPSDIANLLTSADQMKHIVTTLLTLARSESFKLVTFKLRPVLEECVLLLYPKLSEQSFYINLDVEETFEVTAHKQQVILLVINLIENALAHSTGNTLLIRLIDHQLSFENDISNPISESKVNNLTEEKVKKINSTGLGHGLYLVRRVIGALNWQFEIKSTTSTFTFCINIENNKN
jgi:signal transduction histidine kinase